MPEISGVSLVRTAFR